MLAGTRQECEAELAALDRTIAAKEGELAGVQRQLAAAAQRAASLADELAAKERRLKALYEKQGRGAQVRRGREAAGAGAGASGTPTRRGGPAERSQCLCVNVQRNSPRVCAPPSFAPLCSSQFNSQAERDEWCRQEVAQLQATVAQKRENQRGARQQLEAAQAEAEEVRRRGLGPALGHPTAASRRLASAQQPCTPTTPLPPTTWLRLARPAPRAQVAGQAEEVRGALGERDEAAKAGLEAAQGLARQRDDLQNQQRALFQREQELAECVGAGTL